MIRNRRVSSDAVYPTTNIRVQDVPQHQRPREVLDRVGVEHVEDHVLLAVILRSGVRGMSVIQLARRLLDEYGSLTQVAQASVEDLSRRIHGMGRVKAQVLKASLELAHRLSLETVPARRSIRTPEDAARELRNRVRSHEEEKFWVLLLDAKNFLKRPPVEVTSGLVDASLVHPREVFKEAIRSSSAAVVLVHNHPSGDPAPSAEDIQITRQLVDAGRVVDIRVLDHIILGQPSTERERDFFSFRESGLVSF